MCVNIRIDIGSIMLAINENIQEQLQLPVVVTRKSQVAKRCVIFDEDEIAEEYFITQVEIQLPAIA